ncbi:hypothetical protein CLU79DRAFT_717359 [Phycomyces nitens]|nr:hypothetical protein CLU79DRAFT_717359 [Phycomyces nitens]
MSYTFKDTLPQELYCDIASILASIRLNSFTDPPFCFCNRVASQKYTDTYGIVYECYNFDTKQPPSDQGQTNICAFHIHKRPWNMLRQYSRDTGLVDCNNSEFTVCPVFNFTFCVLLKVSNPYPKRPCFRRKCFCNTFVVLKEVKDVSNRTLFAFTCPNFYIDGARPKCSWFLWAENVPFENPGFTLHTPIPSKEPCNGLKAGIY